MKKPLEKEDWKNIIKLKLSQSKNMINLEKQNVDSNKTNEIASFQSISKKQSVESTKSKEVTPLHFIPKTSDLSKEAPRNPPTKLKVYINSEGLVVIKPSNKILAGILSPLDNSIYDIKNNEWRIRIKDYFNIKKTLFKNSFVFQDIPKGALSLCMKEITANQFDFSDGIYKKLFQFQLEGVEFSLNRNGRVILADEMGLGKTLQALGIVHYYRMEWPFIVICPASLQDNWADSIYTFLGIEAVIVRSKEDIKEGVLIFSYQFASKFSEELKNYSFNIIICDECHYLKGNGSKRVINIAPVLQKSNRLVMISGTPIVSRPIELYNILYALDKSLFPNMAEYGKRYCNARRVHNWIDYRGSSNMEELNYILKKYYMIRREKKDVLHQLPPKTRLQIILSVENKIDSIDSDLLMRDRVDQSTIAQYLEAAKLKIEPVKSYIDTVYERGIKFIVFAHHAVMLDGLSEHFESKNIKFIRIDGSVPSANRFKLVKKFQEDDGIMILLLSLTACNMGLTLTAAKIVIFAELYWNPGTLLQAEDRVHRIGQTDTVNIYYIVAKNTVDEYVWPLILRKLNVLQSLGVGANTLKKIDNYNFDEGQTYLDKFVQK